jgi:hypothetical protein
VQTRFSKWRPWGSLESDDPAAAARDYLPLGLILTVAVDGFIDGFVIGARGAPGFRPVSTRKPCVNP